MSTHEHPPSSELAPSECVHCLRRDLATRDRDVSARDRELADEQARRRDAVAEMMAVGRERDQARAALAEKEWGVAAAGATCSFLTTENHRLNAALAAAQEEAKGLRALVERLAKMGRAVIQQTRLERDAIALVDALAARQQQPDGRTYRGDGECLECAAQSGETHSNDCQPDDKPDPAPVASDTWRCGTCEAVNAIQHTDCQNCDYGERP